MINNKQANYLLFLWHNFYYTLVIYIFDNISITICNNNNR